MTTKFDTNCWDKYPRKISFEIQEVISAITIINELCFSASLSAGVWYWSLLDTFVKIKTVQGRYPDPFLQTPPYRCRLLVFWSCGNETPLRLERFVHHSCLHFKTKIQNDVTGYISVNLQTITWSKYEIIKHTSTNLSFHVSSNFVWQFDKFGHMFTQKLYEVNQQIYIRKLPCPYSYTICLTG